MGSKELLVLQQRCSSSSLFSMLVWCGTLWPWHTGRKTWNWCGQGSAGAPARLLQQVISRNMLAVIASELYNIHKVNAVWQKAHVFSFYRLVIRKKKLLIFRFSRLSWITQACVEDSEECHLRGSKPVCQVSVAHVKFLLNLCKQTRTTIHLGSVNLFSDPWWSKL